MDQLFKSFIKTCKNYFITMKRDIKKKIRQLVCKCGEK